VQCYNSTCPSIALLLLHRSALSAPAPSSLLEQIKLLLLCACACIPVPLQEHRAHTAVASVRVCVAAGIHLCDHMPLSLQELSLQAFLHEGRVPRLSRLTSLRFLSMFDISMATLVLEVAELPNLVTLKVCRRQDQTLSVSGVKLISLFCCVCLTACDKMVSVAIITW